MSKTSIIFGNGLSRALNNEYFLLETAMSYVWDSKGCCLTSDEKDLIKSTLEDKNYPNTESDLYNIQEAITITEFLKKFNIDGNNLWIKETAFNSHEAFKKFIHQVAMYFNNYEMPTEKEHWGNFILSLVKFIKENGKKGYNFTGDVNIFTLNYDNLLYKSLLKKKILCGQQNSYLIDGYSATGFSPNMLTSNRGYYFHLHGSPYFIGNEKHKKSNTNISSDNHIVLNHFKHKENIINSSYILSSYWKFMKSRLDLSDNIILFGYGGYDIHLNKILYQLNNYKKKNIKIVECEKNINKISNDYKTKKTAEYFEKSEEDVRKICTDETHEDCEKITKYYRSREIGDDEDDEFLEYLYTSNTFKSKKEFWQGNLGSISDKDLILIDNILCFDDWKCINEL